jgi:hypothetical protein
MVKNAIHVWAGQHANINDKVHAWDIVQVPFFLSHLREGVNLKVC